MKKISLILSVLMLLSVFFAACNNDAADNSGDNSEASAESSIDPSESSVPGGPTSVSVREGAHETVISTGCPYTKSMEPHENSYPDTYGTELTDGILLDESSDNYFDECLSGYSTPKEELVIQVDLGNVNDKVYMFKCGYLATTSAGINVPSYVRVQYSADGEEWSKPATLKKAAFVEGTRQEASIRLSTYVSARYVRFITKASSYWLFLDEVMVIADEEAEDINSVFAEQVNAAYEKYGAPNAPVSELKADHTLFPVLVSRNAKYKIEGKTVSTFPDSDSKMLTDGKTSGVYEGETWVGFEGGQNVKVTVDLGTVIDDISTFEVRCYTNTGIGNFLPVAVRVTAVDSGDNRVEIGNIYASKTKTVGAYSFVLPLGSAVSAKQIEFEIVISDTKMVLIEECGVYAYREYQDSLMYPDVVLDKADHGAWPNASGETVNLIKGLYPQISSVSDPGVYSDYQNTPITSPLLTDGVYSTGTDIHNGKFFKFWSGTGRKVYYDFGHVSAVESFKASFVDYSDWAVHAPKTVNIILSTDAENWYNAGIIEITGSGNSVYKGELSLGRRIQARYVVFEFGVNGWAGCDELEVYGAKTSAGASAVNASGLEEYSVYSGKRMAPREDLLGGLTDLVLLYNGTKSRYTEDDVLPYLAYIDTEKNIKDVMFDSFLFLPSQLPSGRKSWMNANKQDFEWYLNDTFAEGANMNALETVAGKVKEALGLDDNFKYKVTVTMMYPSWEDSNFGDVDGDGVSEDNTVLANRLKVINWFIDETEKRFAECEYKNLELVGYYWMNEDITYTDPNAKELMNAVADKAHSVGKSFFWIPYYCAPGYDAWSQYGFDIACMQPNYVFKLPTPITNLYGCAKLTALYNMGIEIEICEESLFNEQFFDKYMAYLANGTTYNYMNDAVHMYYQGTYIYRDAAYSKTYMGRKAYDSTYHFIKRDLKTVPDAIEIQEFSAEKNVPLRGKFNFPDDGVMRKLRVEVAADHGSVSVNDNGTFDYYPEKDYTGEVKFSFSYSEYLDWSEPMEVVISVN